MSDFEEKRVSEIANEADTADKNERTYTRHSLSDPRIASLSLGPQLTGHIRNLSYSGISVEFPKEHIEVFSESFDNNSPTIDGQLNLGGRIIPTKLSLVRQIGRKIAFIFIHESAETLIYLRETLEPMRIGSTLKPSHGFVGNEWKDRRFILKGDAFSELELEISQKGLLSFARLTFTSLGYIFELSFKQNRLDASLAVINFGSASQTQDTAVLNNKFLRQSLFILLGLDNDMIIDQKSEFIDIIIDKLRKSEEFITNNSAA